MHVLPATSSSIHTGYGTVEARDVETKVNVVVDTKFNEAFLDLSLLIDDEFGESLDILWWLRRIKVSWVLESPVPNDLGAVIRGDFEADHLLDWWLGEDLIDVVILVGKGIKPCCKCQSQSVELN